MSEITQMGVSLVIGAVIGGITNAIAIVMLFRPYEPIFIGKWKLPFSPGLVPKRRKEIAHQLGKIVNEHLIRPKKIQEMLTNNQFKKDMEDLLRKHAETFEHNETTVKELLERFSISFDSKQILLNAIETKKETWGEKTVADLLGDNTTSKIESKIEGATEHILQQLEKYIEGEEAKQILDDTIKRMIANTGMLANMISMFVGNIDISKKVQQEIIKLINRDATKKFVAGAIEKEWEKVKDMQIQDIYEYIVDDTKTKEQIVSVVSQMLSIDKLLNTPIKTIVLKYKYTIHETIIPAVVAEGIVLANKEVPRALTYVKIDKMVEEEINAFSLPKLEQLIVSIAKKELKAITYLGAVLGGVIGLLQGLFYYYF